MLYLIEQFGDSHGAREFPATCINLWQRWTKAGDLDVAGLRTSRTSYNETLSTLLLTWGSERPPTPPVRIHQVCFFSDPPLPSSDFELGSVPITCTPFDRCTTQRGSLWVQADLTFIVRDESGLSCLYQSKSAVLVCCVALSISRMKSERGLEDCGPRYLL